MMKLTIEAIDGMEALGAFVKCFAQQHTFEEGEALAFLHLKGKDLTVIGSGSPDKLAIGTGVFLKELLNQSQGEAVLKALLPAMKQLEPFIKGWKKMKKMND